jgi:hypothetical protein
VKLAALGFKYTENWSKSVVCVGQYSK